MIEKERKFKVKYLPNDLRRFQIEQGYLMFDGRKHLRCRIIDNKEGFLTYKNVVDDRTKLEYEYPIDISDARELMDSCNFKLKKERHEMFYNGLYVCFDFIKEPVELSFVEVEYEDELIEIPPFCGEELTGIKEFTNIEISKKYGGI